MEACEYADPLVPIEQTEGEVHEEAILVWLMFGIWQWFTLRFMVPPPNLIWHFEGCLCNL